MKPSFEVKYFTPLNEKNQSTIYASYEIFVNSVSGLL